MARLPTKPCFYNVLGEGFFATRVERTWDLPLNVIRQAGQNLLTVAAPKAVHVPVNHLLAVMCDLDNWRLRRLTSRISVRVGGRIPPERVRCMHKQVRGHFRSPANRAIGCQLLRNLRKSRAA